MTRSVLLGVLAVLLFCFSLLAIGQTDNTSKGLKAVLNSKSYTLVSPAESWLYPGGFLVSTGKSTTFVDLPSASKKPDSKTVSVDFASEQTKKNFSIGAILTGLTALIGGNPGGNFGHSSSTKLQEIKANGSQITFEAAKLVVADDSVQGTVKQWITPHQQVFVVSTVLTTKNISITADSNTNLDLAFNGSSVSKCTDSSASNTKPSSSGSRTSASGANGSGSPSASNSASGSSGASTDTGTKAKSSKSVTGKSSGPGGAAASAIGGELHLCLSNTNAVTMNSDAALAFAVTAYRAQLVNGKVVLQPAYSIPANGQTENSGASEGLAGQDPNTTPIAQSIAASVSPRVIHKAWPGTGGSSPKGSVGTSSRKGTPQS